VTGVAHGNRSCPDGHPVAGQRGHAVVAAECVRLQAQLGAERLVERHDLRIGHRGGRPLDDELGKRSCEAVVEVDHRVECVCWSYVPVGRRHLGWQRHGCSPG
jgi:hypothetical protein